MSKGKRARQDDGGKRSAGRKRPQGQASAKSQVKQTIDFKITVRGSVADASNLPITGKAIGDMFMTLGDECDVHRGHRWRWSGTEWEDITGSFKGVADDVSPLPTIGNVEDDIALTLNDNHCWRWNGTEWTDQGSYLHVGKRFNQAAIDKYLAKVDRSNGAEVFWAIVNSLIIGLLPPPDIITAFFKRVVQVGTYQVSGLDEAFGISRRRKKGERRPQFTKEQEFYKLVVLITAIVARRYDRGKGQTINFLMFEDVANECRKYELTKKLGLNRYKVEKIYARGKRDMRWIWEMFQAFGVTIVDKDPDEPKDPDESGEPTPSGANA